MEVKMEGEIYFKVIKKKDRSSSIVRGNKYIRLYPKGAIVKAQNKTLGLFCFKDAASALRFMTHDEKIVKVRGIGEPIKSPLVASWYDDISLDSFYTGLKTSMERCWTSVTTQDTICFPSVEVLE
jgi:hypothetical protein